MTERKLVSILRGMSAGGAAAAAAPSSMDSREGTRKRERYNTRATSSRRISPKSGKRIGTVSRGRNAKRARVESIVNDHDEAEHDVDSGVSGASITDTGGVGKDGSEPYGAGAGTALMTWNDSDTKTIAAQISGRLGFDALEVKVSRIDKLVSMALNRIEEMEKGGSIASTLGPGQPPRARAPAVVRLNVGGQIFCTRRSTLTRFEGTYLNAIGSGRFDDEVDADGCIFLDRDPKYFQQILNFLRDPAAPQDFDIEDPGLLHELAFFGIKEHVHKGSLYVAYGFDGQGRLNTIEGYNAHFGTWKEVARFKCELSSPACAVLDGKMYITGGKNSRNRAVATAAYFDPVSRSITETTDLKIPRFGHGLVELDGYIYAVGGYGDDGGRVDSVERYDSKTKTWKTMPGLNDVRSALGCDALNGKIYVAGGYGPGAQPQSLVNVVEVFDPVKNAWEKVSPLGIPRAHVCCIAYNGELWAVGGYDGQHASQVVEIYDPATNKWNAGPSLLRKRSVVVCAVLDDKLYAIGGYDGQSYLKCSEIYDPIAKRWIPGPDMNVSRGRHCVCALPS